MTIVSSVATGASSRAKLQPLYCGGETRAASVFNGLLAAYDAIAGSDWVLVHDAARPCLGREELDRLFGRSGRRRYRRAAGGAGGGHVEARQPRLRVVTHTEPRDNLWLAQTPQMFRYRLLVEALRAADPAVATDEARAIEGLGLNPKLVMGDTRNIKVTFPEDLALAELIIRDQETTTKRKPGNKNHTEPPRRQGAKRSKIQTRIKGK